MNLTTLFRKSIRQADQITKTLQCEVLHSGWDGTYSPSGEPNFGEAVRRRAIVELKQELRSAEDGTERLSHTRVTFVGPVAVHTLDHITLPDGMSPRILSIEAPLGEDAVPFAVTVWF
jgi:hypothetical protein